MSYSHTQRRKLIHRLKRKYGEHKTMFLGKIGGRWHKEFREICDFERRAKNGPLLGSLQDLMDEGLI